MVALLIVGAGLALMTIEAMAVVAYIRIADRIDGRDEQEGTAS